MVENKSVHVKHSQFYYFFFNKVCTFKSLHCKPSLFSSHKGKEDIIAFNLYKMQGRTLSNLE